MGACNGKADAAADKKYEFEGISTDAAGTVAVAVQKSLSRVSVGSVFTVTLDKSSGKPLGFMIDKSDPANLRINSFVDGCPGLAGEYNKTAPADRKLMPGFIICKVNGEGGSTMALLEKMKATTGTLELEVMSVEVPMWEVCIQKSRLTPLGMKTKDIPDSTSVMVVDIVANSPLAKFNKETQQQAIEVGDVISSCNGVFSVEEIGASTHPTHAGKQRTYYLGEIIQRVGDEAKLKVARAAPK
jgi:hypothetical protein